MRAKRVAAAEQYRLIMECRASGLTDYQWCMEHDIKPGTFYNWVKRLRQKGCVMDQSGEMNSNPVKQEVVKLDFSKQGVEVLSPSDISEPETAGLTVSETPVLELSIADTAVRIPQGTDGAFLRQVLCIVKDTLC